MLSILAVICPPVAVALVGKPSQCVTNLGLSLLLFIPGVVHALGVVELHHTEQRNETLMRIAARYYA
jgi:uncharacterized membrane protein YqaE (UPF0057 family)